MVVCHPLDDLSPMAKIVMDAARFERPGTCYAHFRTHEIRRSSNL